MSTSRSLLAAGCVALSALSFTGCGGSTPAAVPPAPLAANQPPARTAPASITVHVLGTGAAQSSSARSPRFVSRGTSGLLVQATPHGHTFDAPGGGVSVFADLSPASVLCKANSVNADNGRDCTISVNAPVGNDDVFAAATDGPPSHVDPNRGFGTGFDPSVHYLSKGLVSGTTISATGTNQIGLTLNGIPVMLDFTGTGDKFDVPLVGNVTTVKGAGVVLVLDGPGPTTTAAVTLRAWALDASGNRILPPGQFAGAGPDPGTTLLPLVLKGSDNFFNMPFQIVPASFSDIPVGADPSSAGELSFTITVGPMAPTRSQSSLTFTIGQSNDAQVFLGRFSAAVSDLVAGGATTGLVAAEQSSATFTLSDPTGACAALVGFSAGQTLGGPVATFPITPRTPGTCALTITDQFGNALQKTITVAPADVTIPVHVPG